jgi:8-oxo-dGTP pyrophosphatase MutT (NUDIX family)
LHRSDTLRQTLEQRLLAYPARLIAPGELRRAAVALAVVDAGPGAQLPGFQTHSQWSTDAAFVLTRRAARMTRHAGQWSLPGGRIDELETPLEAALRELQEEVGLVVDPSCVLGTLDDYATRSGFVITPFVVWAGSSPTLTPDPNEVAGAHRIPFTELLRDDAPILDPPHAGFDQPVLRMPLGNNWVAAPTAAILYQFAQQCLLDRPMPVAHFDQPRFTWK